MMISVARDFSTVPAGRYLNDGPYSGERFREDYLVRGLREHGAVTVDIDGTDGYGSSFLEEAFGGLVRKGYFSAEELHRKLAIKVSNAAFRAYEKAIWRYIDQAAGIVSHAR